jgi:probable rRNA maturation factor
MILNRQRSVRVPIAELERFLARASRKLGLSAGALTVCLVTPSAIARWNRAYRGKSRPTDVLSFPTDARNSKSGKERKLPKRKSGTRGQSSSASFISSTSSTSYMGDIAIAPSIARTNARRFARTLDGEMRILILHGILHLMGYDHETDSGQMDRREQRLRAELGLA